MIQRTIGTSPGSPINTSNDMFQYNPQATDNSFNPPALGKYSYFGITASRVGRIYAYIDSCLHKIRLRVSWQKLWIRPWTPIPQGWESSWVSLINVLKALPERLVSTQPISKDLLFSIIIPDYPFKWSICRWKETTRRKCDTDAFNDCFLCRRQRQRRRRWGNDIIQNVLKGIHHWLGCKWFVDDHRVYYSWCQTTEQVPVKNRKLEIKLKKYLRYS